jgi:hypothetical protein
VATPSGGECAPRIDRFVPKLRAAALDGVSMLMLASHRIHVRPRSGLTLCRADSVSARDKAPRKSDAASPSTVCPPTSHLSDVFKGTPLWKTMSESACAPWVSRFCGAWLPNQS